MKLQDLKNLQIVLKHYLELTKRNKKDAIRKIAERLSYIVEVEILKQ